MRQWVSLKSLPRFRSYILRSMRNKASLFLILLLNSLIDFHTFSIWLNILGIHYLILVFVFLIKFLFILIFNIDITIIPVLSIFLTFIYIVKFLILLQLCLYLLLFVFILFFWWFVILNIGYFLIFVLLESSLILF